MLNTLKTYANCEFQYSYQLFAYIGDELRQFRRIDCTLPNCHPLYAIAHDYSSISSVRLFDPNSLIEITHERTNEPEKKPRVFDLRRMHVNSTKCKNLPQPQCDNCITAPRNRKYSRITLITLTASARRTSASDALRSG